ncbi:MAG TPA: hypothetical protein VHX44_16370 [Planctomycetota bacterium]|nr:hypothetical protein [Planctomycetota bacterium]
MLMVFSLITAVTVYWVRPRPVSASVLANGLLILGILSLIPILPMVIGKALILVVTDAKDINWAPSLNLGQGATVTAAFAIIWLIGAFGLGSMLYVLRIPNRRSTNS